METVRLFEHKNEQQHAFKQIMHKIDIECVKYKKSKSSARKMGKYKHKEVKDLADYVREHKKKDYDIAEGIKAEKALAMKIKKIEETLMGPKHKITERSAIFDPVTKELKIDETRFWQPH